jgi:hypothetical protein
MIILTYATSLILSGFVESLYMYEKVSQLNFIMRTAGDMALEQTQITDDFFKPNDSFVVKDRLVDANKQHKDFKIKVPNTTNTKFEEVNLYQEYTGIDVTSANAKSAIYDRLYSADGSAFKQELDKSDPEALKADKIKKIKTPIININSAGGLDTIFIPTLAQMGIANTGTYKEQTEDDKRRITGHFGKYISSSDLHGMNKELRKGYELDRVTKMSELDGKDIDYYLTPLSLGITYLDKDLLQLLFINNVNLLMRAKYSDNMDRGGSDYIGRGILRGQTFADVVDNSAGRMDENYINNGVISAEVGSPSPGHGKLRQGSSNRNERVEIRYKVIDMYDNANERILKEVLGVIPQKQMNDFRVSKYGDYYKALDLKDRQNGTTVTQLTKPIVVAEVKFKLNTIIPYSTLGMRELRAYSRPSAAGVKSRNLLNIDESQFNTRNNYLDMRPMQITGKSPTYQASGIPQDGPRLVEYTRLFAITP